MKLISSFPLAVLLLVLAAAPAQSQPDGFLVNKIGHPLLATPKPTTNLTSRFDLTVMDAQAAKVVGTSMTLDPLMLEMISGATPLRSGEGLRIESLHAPGSNVFIPFRVTGNIAGARFEFDLLFGSNKTGPEPRAVLSMDPDYIKALALPFEVVVDPSAPHKITLEARKDPETKDGRETEAAGPAPAETGCGCFGL